MRKCYILFGIILIFIVVVGCMHNNTRVKDEHTELDEQYSYDQNKVKSVKIDCYACNIFIEDDENVKEIEVKIVGKMSTNLSFDVQQDKDMLQITQSLVDKGTDVTENQVELHITVPDSSKKSYAIKMNAGEMYVTGCHADFFQTELKAGDIIFDSCKVNNKSSNCVYVGNITAKHCGEDVENLNLSAKLGNVDVE